MSETQPLEGRVFVVTGANTGIGRATAAGLAAQGAHVVLACRSEAKTVAVLDAIVESTGNEAVEYLHLDLSDLESVRAAAASLVERDVPLHGLVNNAGVGGQRGVTAQGFELAFGVNHLGHFLLTTLLLDRLRSSGARVVTVSSDAHYQATRIDFDALQRPTRTATGLREYAVSKLCNVLFTQELARLAPAKEIAAFSLHPGVIASDIWRRVPWPARTIMKLLMRSPEDGAATSLYCATSQELAGKSGGFYADCREKAASKVATEELARELWEHSEEWT